MNEAERDLVELDIEKLAKVWALAEQGIAGEADVARARAAAMVTPHGYTLEDIPGLLEEDGAEPPQPGPGGFTFYNMNNPAHRRAYQREQDARRRQWMRDNADRIAEVIARYGSSEAVFAPTPQEAALDAAIEPFRDVRKEGGFQTFDGESFRPTERVAQAMGAVIPWPETIPAALAEYEAWEKVLDDRNVADGNNQGDYLSEGADLRRTHLQDMVEKLIPARDLSDLIVRMRFLIGLDYRIDAPEVILADLERLQEAETRQGVCSLSREILSERRSPASSDGNMGDSENRATTPSILNTATKRRAEVKRILSTPEGARMSLRQVAGMVGVSPATVMKIKKQI